MKTHPPVTTPQGQPWTPLDALNSVPAHANVRRSRRIALATTVRMLAESESDNDEEHLAASRQNFEAAVFDLLELERGVVAHNKARRGSRV